MTKRITMGVVGRGVGADVKRFGYIATELDEQALDEGRLSRAEVAGDRYGGPGLGSAEAANTADFRDSSLSAKSVSCCFQLAIRDVSEIASAPVSAPRNRTTSASCRAWHVEAKALDRCCGCHQVPSRPQTSPRPTGVARHHACRHGWPWEISSARSAASRRSTAGDTEMLSALASSWVTIVAACCRSREITVTSRNSALTLGLPHAKPRRGFAARTPSRWHRMCSGSRSSRHSQPSNALLRAAFRQSRRDGHRSFPATIPRLRHQRLRSQSPTQWGSTHLPGRPFHRWQ